MNEKVQESIAQNTRGASLDVIGINSLVEAS
jgi:hypothetical protein